MLKIGDLVLYVDREGQFHNALVTHVWTEICVNLVYIGEPEEALVLQATSVPFKAEDMTGFYYWV